MKIRAINTGRGWGKTTAAKLLWRYEAAVHLEHARQIIRECSRYGYPISQVDADEVKNAEEQYSAATAAACA